MCDPEEFLSALRNPQPVQGPRSRSLTCGTAASVGYEPAEADSKIKGGNSNWRGPIWFPTSFLLIESLRNLAKAYGADFSVDVPGGTGAITFSQMARELADRLIRIFHRDGRGRRPVYGGDAQVPGRSALARPPLVL